MRSLMTSLLSSLLIASLAQAGGEKTSATPAQSTATPSQGASGTGPSQAASNQSAPAQSAPTKQAEPVNKKAPFDVKPEALALVTFKLEDYQKVSTAPTTDQVIELGVLQDGVNLSGIYAYRKGYRVLPLGDDVVAGFEKIKPLIKIGKLFSYPASPEQTPELFMYSTIICPGTIVPGCRYGISVVQQPGPDGQPQKFLQRTAAKTWNDYHFVEYIMVINDLALTDGETVMSADGPLIAQVAYFLDFNKKTMTTAFNILTQQEYEQLEMQRQAKAIQQEAAKSDTAKSDASKSGTNLK